MKPKGISTHRMRVKQVGEHALLPHQLAVDHHGEVDVEDYVVIDGETEDDAYQ